MSKTIDDIIVPCLKSISTQTNIPIIPVFGIYEEVLDRKRIKYIYNTGHMSLYTDDDHLKTDSLRVTGRYFRLYQNQYKEILKTNPEKLYERFMK